VIGAVAMSPLSRSAAGVLARLISGRRASGLAALLGVAWLICKRLRQKAAYSLTSQAAEVQHVDNAKASTPAARYRARLAAKQERGAAPGAVSRLPQDRSNAVEASAAADAPKLTLGDGRPAEEMLPNLSGTWLIVRGEGDAHAYFKDVGAGFARLALLKTFNYGVGKMTHHILQRGDDVVIVAQSPKGTVRQKFRVNGLEQDTLDTADGSPIKASAVWDGNSLLLSASREGKACNAARRYFRGDEMILELTSAENRVVLNRVLQKQTLNADLQSQADEAMGLPDESPPAVQPAEQSSPGSSLALAADADQEEVAKKERPNFSGTWHIVRDEGDARAYFQDMGAGIAKLAMYKAMNFGVGKATHHIVHQGEEISITAKSPRGTFQQKLRVDGSEQSTVDTANGRPIEARLTWDGDVLLMATRRRGQPWYTARRYFRGQDLIFELTSPVNQVTLRRVMVLKPT